MLLAVDIGNTNTVAGVFRGDELVAQWRVATDRVRMADEYAALAATLFRISRIEAGRIGGAIVAGVVPTAQTAICESIARYLHLPPMVVSSELDLGIDVRVQGAGADRIANAVAAVEAYGTPAIVVDFGTGTNFDVVDRLGRYVGGAIAPGLEIAVAALFSGTAQLPHVPLEAPPAAIGDRTVTALQSGIIFGFAGLVDGLVRRIDAELGGQSHVIATGGLARVVAPHAETVRHVDEDLTLRGLRSIYQRNESTRAASGAGED